jgi:hypothetical protein
MISNVICKEGDAKEKGMYRLQTEPNIYTQRMRSGQSSMLLIIVVLMMFVGIAVFLLSLASTASRDEFTSLYVNNLLLSVMRTDTGYADSKCKLVSDLVACAYITPDWMCGETRCDELANSTVSKYMMTFSNQTMSLKYLFNVTTIGFYVIDENTGEPKIFEIGDPSLKKSRESFKVFSYPRLIPKTVNSNTFYLKVQLIVASK